MHWYVWICVGNSAGLAWLGLALVNEETNELYSRSQSKSICWMVLVFENPATFHTTVTNTKLVRIIKDLSRTRCSQIIPSADHNTKFIQRLLCYGISVIQYQQPSQFAVLSFQISLKVLKYTAVEFSGTGTVILCRDLIIFHN